MLELHLSARVSRTFVETICGIGGVVVREMGGEIGYGYPYGGFDGFSQR